MKSLHIRDLPELVVERLKRRAQSHHRSLQGELHHVLTEAAKLPLPDDSEDLALKTVRSTGGQDWSRESIYED